ncbi:heme oxygenase isoform B [Chlorella sorokiniana]|uniref:heme oxygenase (biliverdin-producing) n=1 Tax=Chlorella sorokiniana TaxID=3076 RepID=A0A2P6TH38_CHLSO|nr:heme oxygenase isoform B [Chlorella sorokiniana]|eukprot:PRW33603.1 heme oxygenase isoform B [Chlorella sorokiniana]
MGSAPPVKRQRSSGSGGSGAAAGIGAAATGPLAGVAVFVQRNSLQSGAQLDAWKRSLPALGGALIESEAAYSDATHALVPSGSKGGWPCLPQTLQPGSAAMPAGLHYVTEHWLAACIRNRARMPEHDFAPAAAVAAAAAGPPMAKVQEQGAAAAALQAAALPSSPAAAAATSPIAAVAAVDAAEAGSGSVPAESGGNGGGGSDPDDSSGEEAEDGGEGSGDPGRCSAWYAREAGQMAFAPERHEDDNRTCTLLSWNIWDCLDRQCFEERMLEIGREIARNDFPDVILLQEVSQRALGLLSRQPWLAAYLRSPVPERIRCCTMILLRKDRVGPPPAHREVQWLEPYICGLNDERGEVGFPRDVKSVRCTILGRPVRISTTHLVHWGAGLRQWYEVNGWLSQQQAVNPSIDLDWWLAGDFNWHYPKPMAMPPGWVDVWATLMPHNTGHTWSSLARTGQPTGPARLDRVCARVHSFRPIQIDNLTGSQPIQGAVRLRRTGGRRPAQEIAAYVSDHPHATFLEELRDYSMKLHTKSQAPKEGQAPEPKQQKPFEPTREGFLNFMVESKVVYDAFEDIMREAAVPFYAQLANTGLERGAALEKDIAYMQQQWGLQAPVAAEDGIGHRYAKLLRELAVNNPPAFICHYYNHYFAHTAGGRMIGKSVSNAVLDGWTGAFYEWEGDVKALLDSVRNTVNTVAEGWSREEKDACLEATPGTFTWGGQLVSLITGGKPLQRPARGQPPAAVAGVGAFGGGGGEFAGAPPPTSAAPIAEDHQIEDHAAAMPAEPSSSGKPSSNGKPHLPSSIYVAFPKDSLPPDGHTLTLKEQKCNPETERCRTPIHVWESRCRACDGTGIARWVTSRQRHHVMSVCVLCSGLGYVRHTSTHSVPHVNGCGPHTTIGRPPAPETKPHRFSFGGHWPGKGGSGGSGGSASGSSGSSGSSKPKK